LPPRKDVPRTPAPALSSRALELTPALVAVGPGRAALELALGGPPLLRQPAGTRGAGGAGGAARGGDGERGLDPLGQARQGEIAVARLGALILDHCHQPRPDAVEQPSSLRLAQRRRAHDIEDGLDTGCGDIGVLASRARGAARAHRDLGERDLEAALHAQELVLVDLRSVDLRPLVSVAA